jgi:hypothetical protein
MAVLTAADRLGNALLLGDDRQTISARCHYAREAGKRWGIIAATAIDWVALHVFGQADHCRKAAEFDAAIRALTTP